MSALPLLVITTDATLVETIAHVADSIGDLSVQVLNEVEEAHPWLDRREASLVLVHLPHDRDPAPIMRLLQKTKSARLAVGILVVSDQQHSQHAIDLLRLGVADYMSRPLDVNRLTCLIDALTIRNRSRVRRSVPLEDSLAVLGDKDSFVYLRSEGLCSMMEQVLRVAPQDTTILLGGETGTGKTRLARLIHELSPRSDQRLLVANCGALSPTLIESELFGHVKGAFTGADRERAGKFAEAGGGTLLLDEIDALPPVLQAKLLRVVEERVFEPVGSEKTLPMRARLIAASNRDLEHEVAEGRFRSDLFFRMNVVGFCLPPLRERAGIIPTLVERCVAEFAARNARPVKGIAAAALRALHDYHWPGNIRELRNVIERAVALCPGSLIRPEDLPASLFPTGTPPMETPPFSPALSASPATLVRAKEEAEAALIARILQKHKNNRERTAAELGISRMTLYNKLHRYGLMNPRYTAFGTV